VVKVFGNFLNKSEKRRKKGGKRKELYKDSVLPELVT
jgi:hypothetical protein